MKKGIVSLLAGAAVGTAIGAITVNSTMGNKVNDWKSMSDKHLALFLMMTHWVKIKQEGKSLADYFEKKGYRKIAIYGMSYAGETLLEELKGTNVEVVCGIDQKAHKIYSDVMIVSPDDELGDVDAVVVTAITYFSEVEERLSEKIECPIISLEDILYEVE